jgi:hypothetical protein
MNWGVHKFVGSFTLPSIRGHIKAHAIPPVDISLFVEMPWGVVVVSFEEG